MTVTNNSQVQMNRLSIALLLLILLGGVLGRAYRIETPLFERHAHRQYDTAAVARNFYEGSMNIFYPQVDWGGTSPGYVESEFPIYGYVVAVLYEAFGVHEWLGRAVNIGVYALSALLLFFFVRRFAGERAAFLATFFYSIAPLSFTYTRTFQGDALVAMCSLAGIYFFWLWTEEDRWVWFTLSTAATALAVLIKPNSLYMGLPLAYLCFTKYGWSFLRKPLLWLFATIVVVPSVLWYVHAAEIWRLYGNSFYRLYVRMGYVIPPSSWPWLSFAKRLVVRLSFLMATPAGLVLLLLGFFARPPRANYVIHWWAMGFGVSLLLAAPNHRGHEYYQLPAVFLVTVWMALGTLALWENKKFISQRATRLTAAALCLLVVAFSIREIRMVLPARNETWPRVTFGQRVNQLTEPTALIVFVKPRLEGIWRPEQFQHRTEEGEFIAVEPIDFYLSHRKGWSLDEGLSTPAFVESLRARGAKYFATFYPEILGRHPDLRNALDRYCIPVEVTSQWVIYRLQAPPSSDLTPEKVGKDVRK